MDEHTLKVIEEFYRIWETLDGYTRPADWQERALRVITGMRNRAAHNKEGVTKWYQFDGN